MAKKHCNCCGAPIVEYKHSLSKGLARCLYRLVQAGGGPVNANTLGLNYNQQSNFQKLRYWGLIEKSDPGSEKGGFWELTPKGWEFVKGSISVPRSAITYRGEVIRTEGGIVAITDITEGWWYRKEYAEQSQAHTAGGA